MNIWWTRTALLFSAYSMLTGCAADTAESTASTDSKSPQDTDVSHVEQGLSSSCYGASCDYRDPSLCEPDAYTVASSQIYTSGGLPTGRIAIRYSPSCNAAWARTSTDYGTAFLRAELTRSNPSATTQSATPSATSAQRSLMLGVSSGARFTAIGRIGPSYGNYPYTGNVLTNF